MAVSTKDYEKIAEILKNFATPVGIFTDDYEAGRYYATANIAEEFVKFFKAENPRFDRERFLEACELL